MGRVRKGKIPRGQSSIPTPKEIHFGLVCFSFKYMELEHQKFDLPNTAIKDSYLGTLFNRLKSISTMKFNEFRQAGDVLRSHKISWERTSEPSGYSHLSPQIQECEPWQFSLASNRLGRIHGFLLSEIFYVVWIDHEHRLYQN